MTKWYKIRVAYLTGSLANVCIVVDEIHFADAMIDETQCESDPYLNGGTCISYSDGYEYECPVQ